MTKFLEGGRKKAVGQTAEGDFARAWTQEGTGPVAAAHVADDGPEPKNGSGPSAAAGAVAYMTAFQRGQIWGGRSNPERRNDNEQALCKPVS